MIYHHFFVIIYIHMKASVFLNNFLLIQRNSAFFYTKNDAVNKDNHNYK